MLHREVRRLEDDGQRAQVHNHDLQVSQLCIPSPAAG